MTKARQTTFDERVEIVKYCIENGMLTMKPLKSLRFLPASQKLRLKI